MRDDRCGSNNSPRIGDKVYIWFGYMYHKVYGKPSLGPIGTITELDVDSDFVRVDFNRFMWSGCINTIAFAEDDFTREVRRAIDG